MTDKGVRLLGSARGRDGNLSKKRESCQQLFDAVVHMVVESVWCALRQVR